MSDQLSPSGNGTPWQATDELLKGTKVTHRRVAQGLVGEVVGVRVAYIVRWDTPTAFGEKETFEYPAGDLAVACSAAEGPKPDSGLGEGES